MTDLVFSREVQREDPILKDMEKDEFVSLNEEQSRAYDIVDWHLRQVLAGTRPPQLRMIVPGEGGTGKSKNYPSDYSQLRRASCSGLFSERSLYWDRRICDRWPNIACADSYANERHVIGKNDEKTG